MSLSRDTLKTEEEKKEERMKEDEGKKSLSGTENRSTT